MHSPVCRHFGGSTLPTFNPHFHRFSPPVLSAGRDATNAAANAASPASPSRPMDEAGDFSALIGDVYDAALDPAHWPAAIDQVARFVGGSAAALYSKDAARRSGEFYYDNNRTDPQSRRLYREQYAQLDPTTIGHVFAEIDQPMATEDLIPYNDYVETRFYQEWARPQGFAFGVSALSRSADVHRGCGLRRRNLLQPVRLDRRRRGKGRLGLRLVEDIGA